MIPHQGIMLDEEQQLTLDLLDREHNNIVQSLVFKDSFRDIATVQRQRVVKQWMRQNRRRVKRMKLRESDVRVVGVHHRRGDHLQYETDHGIPHITMSYLGPSMDLFR